MTRITYYHILGVSSDASEDEIAASFRKKVKQWHPDICRHPDAEERMREINEAAEVLCDPERRLRYDRALAGKIPFESVTVQRQHEKEEPGHGWSRFFHGKAGTGTPSRPRFSSESIRFVATGIAAVLILGVLLLSALSAIPLLAEPLNPAGAIAGQAPAAAVITPEDALQVQQEGNARLAAGDYEGALQAYNAVIAQNPAIAERDLWYNRGIAQNALGLYPEAAESFDRVLKVAPEDSFALAQKGAALIGLGRYEESLHYTDQALSDSPDTAWIWNNRGIALAGIGQQKEARAAFDNAGIFAGRSDSSLMYRNIVLRPGSVARF